MGKLKEQLAGIAALVAAIVAIGGGFVKYGEITTKLEALESQEQSVVDTSSIESSIAVLKEKVKKLENADTSHSHDTSHTHDDTNIKIVEKEIELLKTRIEEIKVKSTNPLAN
tara:strand:+ start:273 stop:611 length:339 start_codon:yes stop_codon:yes gene_type:complete